MAFIQRNLNYKFVLGKGAFGTDPNGPNTLDVTGLRSAVQISLAGGNFGGALEAQIYGLPLDTMNKLTQLYIVPEQIRKAQLIVMAQSGTDAPQRIFVGTIFNAWADLHSAPDAVLRVIAYPDYYESVAAAAPTNYPASATAASILQNLADQMGLQFESNGLTIPLPAQSLQGSLLDQVKKVVEAAHVESIIDNGILAIWPINGFRNGGTNPILSKETGMINYPMFNSVGVVVQSIFNPAIRFGYKLQIQSDIAKVANGVWVVYGLEHDLEANIPGGRWTSTISAAPSGNPIPLPQ